jgi:hypothetical protein
MLVRGLMRCPIFKASNSDSDNCQAVYRLSSTAANDDNAKALDEEKETEWFDEYEPGFTKQFRSSQPTEEYVLDPDELEVKFEKVKRKEGPGPLAFILEMAMGRKELCKNRVFENQFTDGRYIDFACLQDPNRGIEVDTVLLKTVGLESLLKVMIDSYVLPSKLTLEMAIDKRTKLISQATIIQCNWVWLEKELLPEVAANLEEKLFGIHVIKDIGLDHPDSSVANRDAPSMASFLAGSSFRNDSS